MISRVKMGLQVRSYEQAERYRMHKRLDETMRRVRESHILGQDAVLVADGETIGVIPARENWSQLRSKLISKGVELTKYGKGPAEEFLEERVASTIDAWKRRMMAVIDEQSNQRRPAMEACKQHLAPITILDEGGKLHRAEAEVDTTRYGEPAKSQLLKAEGELRRRIMRSVRETPCCPMSSQLLRIGVGQSIVRREEKDHTHNPDRPYVHNALSDIRGTVSLLAAWVCDHCGKKLAAPERWTDVEVEGTVAALMPRHKLPPRYPPVERSKTIERKTIYPDGTKVGLDFTLGEKLTNSKGKILVFDGYRGAQGQECLVRGLDGEYFIQPTDLLKRYEEPKPTTSMHYDKDVRPMVGDVVKIESGLTEGVVTKVAADPGGDDDRGWVDVRIDGEWLRETISGAVLVRRRVEEGLPSAIGKRKKGSLAHDIYGP